MDLPQFLFYLRSGEENLKHNNLAFPNFNVAIQTKKFQKAVRTKREAYVLLPSKAPAGPHSGDSFILWLKLPTRVG